MTILVVDDAPTVRAYHRQLLEILGYRVVEAVNGLEALEKLLTDKTLRGVLLDINMPAMDGYSMLKEWRSNPELAQLPVIMISTEAEDQDLEAAFLCGANAYRVKPVAQADLSHLVQCLVGPASDPAAQEQQI